MHYGFDDSPPAIVTLDSVRSRWPDASLSTHWPDEKDGASISGHVWVLGVDDVRPYITSCGEWSSNEYDALGEMSLFLNKARAAYFSKGRQDRVAEVDRFASQITYLDRKAFVHGVKTISDEWISRIDSGETIMAALPSANDKKDRGVASSEFILAHVFDNIRFACGSLATKKIALLAPDSEISSEIYKSDIKATPLSMSKTGLLQAIKLGGILEASRKVFGSGLV